MTDPAVPYIADGTYPPYTHGHSLDVFLKAGNGSESLGVVWPGQYIFGFTCALHMLMIFI